MIVKILFFILAITLSLLQTTILPLNFLLLLVILAAFWQLEFSFWFAFLSGFTLDLAKGNTLGTSSIKFLILTILIFFLKNKFSIREKRQLKLPRI